MSSIKGELPNISPAVLALALQEARWDVPAAMQLVSIFLQACGSHLEDLKQVLPGSLRTHAPGNTLMASRRSTACMRNAQGQLLMLCRNILRHVRVQWPPGSHLLQCQARTTAAQPGPGIRGKGKARRKSPRRTRSTKDIMLRRYVILLTIIEYQRLRFPDSVASQVFACLYEDTDFLDSDVHGFCIEL